MSNQAEALAEAAAGNADRAEILLRGNPADRDDAQLRASQATARALLAIAQELAGIRLELRAQVKATYDGRV
jgi:hypothetical protein